MASIYDLKPRFQALLRPTARGLAKRGITANQVTVAAAILSVMVGACILWRPESRWPLLLLPVFLFARMALNAIDGMLAREHDMKSPLGAILNEIGDVVSDAALYLPLACVPAFVPWLVILFVVFALIGELTGVVAVRIGASRRYDGPMGKSDRAFVIGLLGLLLGVGVPPGAWVTWIFGAATVLAALTILRRARTALAEIR